MRSVTALACVFLLISCAGKSTNDSSDVKPSAAVGGSIEGTVREQGTDVPISSVKVFLVRSSNESPIQTTTDADGHFVLQGLPAGRHFVALVRDGYVVPGRLDTSGYPFRLTEGQKLSQVVFHLQPAGTISGRVVGVDGSPMNRVEVQLLQNRYLLGRLQWSPVNRGGVARETLVETNAGGEFRLIGVDPGEYALRFVPHEPSVAGVLRGGKATTPMLYPGVREITRATVIQVKPGMETLLKDVKIPEETRGWIRLGLVNQTGEPLEGFGSWQVRPQGWIGSDYPFVEQRIVNNYHEIRPDIPGTYDITATWSTIKGPLVARIRMNYSGADVMSNVMLRKPESSLSGSVLLQRNDGSAPIPLQGVEVAIGPEIPYFIRSGPMGMLTLPMLYAGRYKLGAVRNLPADTYVKAVLQGSRDVMTQDMDVKKGEVQLDVLVSTGAAVLQGTVRNAGGKPIHNAFVALIPEGVLKQRVDYYGAYQSTHTDQNGAFDIHGITPGTYTAYAWTDAPAAAFRNDTFMKAFAGKGTTIDLPVAGVVKLDLSALDSAP